MRTTLEIPDTLFRKAKLRAVEEGVPLKTVVVRAIERELTTSAPSAAARKRRAQKLFAVLDKTRNTEPVGRLNREELYDRAILRGH
jgi:hypothetical protein